MHVIIITSSSSSSLLLSLLLLLSLFVYNVEIFNACILNACIFIFQSFKRIIQIKLFDLSVLFDRLGILLTLSPPAQHQQRIERHYQTLNARIRATLASLPYELPPQLYLLLKLSVAAQLNRIPNSLSTPDTPETLLTGTKPTPHYKYPYLHYGATCIVQIGAAKRQQLSSHSGLPLGSSPNGELGVCVGESRHHPGQYLFILANQKIVPRSTFTPVNTVPFGWRVRTVHQIPVPPPVPSKVDHVPVDPASVPLQLNSPV